MVTYDEKKFDLQEFRAKLASKIVIETINPKVTIAAYRTKFSIIMGAVYRFYTIVNWK